MPLSDRHYSRQLDLSSSVRFANLPNRAQLELAPSAQSRVDGDVTLAVQLTDGGRLVKQFPCAGEHPPPAADPQLARTMDCPGVH